MARDKVRARNMDMDADDGYRYRYTYAYAYRARSTARAIVSVCNIGMVGLMLRSEVESCWRLW